MKFLLSVLTIVFAASLANAAPGKPVEPPKLEGKGLAALESMKVAFREAGIKAPLEGVENLMRTRPDTVAQVQEVADLMKGAGKETVQKNNETFSNMMNALSAAGNGTYKVRMSGSIAEARLKEISAETQYESLTPAEKVYLAQGSIINIIIEALTGKRTVKDEDGKDVEMEPDLEAALKLAQTIARTPEDAYAPNEAGKLLADAKISEINTLLQAKGDKFTLADLIALCLKLMKKGAA